MRSSVGPTIATRPPTGSASSKARGRPQSFNRCVNRTHRWSPGWSSRSRWCSSPSSPPGSGSSPGIEYRTSPASSPSTVENSTLSILGAGTLDTLFPKLANDLVNETPGISAPTAAQTYEGSIDITTAFTSLAAKADVAAVADERLIPQLLEPKFADYEVVFGSTPEVLVYNPAISAFAGINSTNWASKLVTDVTTHGNAPFAVWNASTDPNGYNEIFSLELQGMLYGGNVDAYYSTFYAGTIGAPAVPSSSTTLIEHESQAASLLRAGTVSALITYRAYAVVNGLSFVSFDPIVGLSGNDSTALSEYAKLSTTIVGSSGALVKVVPAPVLFAATVPLDAPNPALGAAFLHLLLSPQGSEILSAGGAFTPIFPGWADRPANVPSAVAPDVVPMPSWASAFLG